MGAWPPPWRKRVGAIVVGLGVIVAAVGGLLVLSRGSSSWVQAGAIADLRSEGVRYLEKENVFVVSNGDRPIAISGIAPHRDDLGERILYCPSSGWFEGQHGEMFDRLGNYVYGPAHSGLSIVESRVRADGTIEVDPGRVVETKDLPDGEAHEHLPAGGPSCSDPDVEEAEPRFARARTDIASAVGIWFDGTGRPLDGVWNAPNDPTELSMYAAPPSCGSPCALIVEVGWPLEAAASSDRMFVRDPEGSLAERFGTVDAMPDDAVDTGFHRGEWRLFISPLDPEAIYMTEGDVIERWPQVTRPTSCISPELQRAT